jgi:hypothetical protein
MQFPDSLERFYYIADSSSQGASAQLLCLHFGIVDI